MGDRSVTGKCICKVIKKIVGKVVRFPLKRPKYWHFPAKIGTPETTFPTTSLNIRGTHFHGL
jgi:hypothetical protein